MAKEWFHSRKLGEDVIILRDEYVTYNQKQVLAIQAQTPTGYYYTIVPGTLIERIEELGKPLRSIVNPIDKERRPELESFLFNRGFKGKFDFWND